MAESIKKFIIKDAHGGTKESGSFSVVGEVHVDIVPGYGEPYAESVYVNGILTITIHNIEGNGITGITTDSQEGDEAVNTVTIKTNANPEGVTLEVRNGSKGSRGNGITSIEQTQKSTDSSGVNIVNIKTTDNPNGVDIEIRNGKQGATVLHGAGDLVLDTKMGPSELIGMTQKAISDLAHEGMIKTESTTSPSYDCYVGTYQGSASKTFYVDGEDGQIKYWQGGTVRTWEIELTPDIVSIGFRTSSFTGTQKGGYAFVDDNENYIDGEHISSGGNNITVPTQVAIGLGATKFRYSRKISDDNDSTLVIKKANYSWPSKYTGTGSNADGWMTQKATTNAINAAVAAAVATVESEIPDYGKKDPITGLSGATAANLTLLNKVVKSFTINANAGEFDKENVRFVQLYFNASTSLWQIQVGFPGATNPITDLETFSINSRNKTSFTSTPTGKFTIVIDWDELDLVQPDSSSDVFADRLITNPYKLHFANDDVYFDGAVIAANSIPEGKLSSDVRSKLNRTPGILNGKHLVTLCDSLGAGGVWQEKLASLTGMTFNKSKNNGTYSIGGTKTLSPYLTCGQGRALRLISDVNNNITPYPDIIIIENVNDGSGNPGTLTDESFILSNIQVLGNEYKQESLSAAQTYWQNNKSTILGSLTPQVGTVLGIPYTTSNGIKLTITHAATANGNFGILLDGSGESVKYVTISAGDSIATIIDKIMEYSFNNYVLERGADYVVFTLASNGTPGLQVWPFSTGITSTITSGIEGTLAYWVYFLGHNVANWSNAGKWVTSVPLYQAWKGMVEMLENAFPKACVYWFIPKTYSFTFADSQYTRADGTPDWDKMLAEQEYQPTLYANQIRMAEYMNIPVLDIRQDACINPGNISEYCNNGSVHPKAMGYNRWGETLARLLS